MTGGAEPHVPARGLVWSECWQRASTGRQRGGMTSICICKLVLKCHLGITLGINACDQFVAQLFARSVMLDAGRSAIVALAFELQNRVWSGWDGVDTAAVTLVGSIAYFTRVLPAIQVNAPRTSSSLSRLFNPSSATNDCRGRRKPKTVVAGANAPLYRSFRRSYFGINAMLLRHRVPFALGGPLPRPTH
jgi:hypothetical protein